MRRVGIGTEQVWRRGGVMRLRGSHVEVGLAEVRSVRLGQVAEQRRVELITSCRCRRRE